MLNSMPVLCLGLIPIKARLILSLEEVGGRVVPRIMKRLLFNNRFSSPLMLLKRRRSQNMPRDAQTKRRRSSCRVDIMRVKNMKMWTTAAEEETGQSIKSDIIRGCSRCWKDVV